MNSPCVPLHPLGLSPHSCLCCRLKSRVLSLNNSLKRTLHAQFRSASDPLKAVQPLPQKLLVPPLTPCSYGFPCTDEGLRMLLTVAGGLEGWEFHRVQTCLGNTDPPLLKTDKQYLPLTQGWHFFHSFLCYLIFIGTSPQMFQDPNLQTGKLRHRDIS